MAVHGPALLLSSLSRSVVGHWVSLFATGGGLGGFMALACLDSKAPHSQ